MSAAKAKLLRLTQEQLSQASQELEHETSVLRSREKDLEHREKCLRNIQQTINDRHQEIMAPKTNLKSRPVHLTLQYSEPKFTRY